MLGALALLLVVVVSVARVSALLAAVSFPDYLIRLILVGSDCSLGSYGFSLSFLLARFEVVAK